MMKWFCRVTCFRQGFSVIVFISRTVSRYFYHKKVVSQRSSHIKLDVTISLRLLLKVWIWCRCQNRIEKYYRHDGEYLGFYKKVHIKTHSLSKENDNLSILLLQETKNSYLLDILKTATNAIFNIAKIDLDEF